MAKIDNVFKPIIGKPCWQVQQGYGSFLTFEFGEPRLRIQEPRQASKQASEKLWKRWQEGISMFVGIGIYGFIFVIGASS